MDTTVKELAEAVSNSMGGLNKLGKAEMPAKLAYRFGRLLDAARSAAKVIQDERTSIFKEMGVPRLDPEGNPTGFLDIPEEKHQDFQVAIEAMVEKTGLMKRQIWYEPVKLSELEATGVRLSPEDLILVAPFIDTEDGSEG